MSDLPVTEANAMFALGAFTGELIKRGIMPHDVTRREDRDGDGRFSMDLIVDEGLVFEVDMPGDHPNLTMEDTGPDPWSPKLYVNGRRLTWSQAIESCVRQERDARG